ncbi:UNVERIFIED_CONTAM: hypothetical protein Sradi_3247300 [Sesamum radiatum]|uniref:Uncharacterized protein n=1 Tax=Sesamum radiatum TaxID=300843 RepID=A0AAW2R121_SESRA
MAIPFLECGFTAYEEQFIAQGYPSPPGEEPSFPDIGAAMVNALNPFATTPVEGDLPLELGNLLP